MARRKPSQSRRDLSQNKKPQSIRKFGIKRPSFLHKQGKPIKNSSTGAVGPRVKPISKLSKLRKDVQLTPAVTLAWDEYLASDKAFGSSNMRRDGVSIGASRNYQRINGVPINEDLQILYNDYPAARSQTCEYQICNGVENVMVYPGTCISCPENAYKPNNNSPLFYDAGWACCGCYDKERERHEKLGWTYVTWLGDGYCDDGAWGMWEYGDILAAESGCQGENIWVSSIGQYCDYDSGIVNGTCWDIDTTNDQSTPDATGVNGPINGNAFEWSENQFIDTVPNGHCFTGRGANKVNLACDDWSWDCGDVFFPADTNHWNYNSEWGTGECYGDHAYDWEDFDIDDINSIADYYHHCNHRLGYEATCQGKCNRNAYRFPPLGDEENCVCPDNDPDCQCDPGGFALTAYDPTLGGWGQCFCDLGCSYCNCPIDDEDCYLDCPGNCANPDNSGAFKDTFPESGTQPGVDCGPCYDQTWGNSGYPDYSQPCPVGPWYDDFPDRLGDCCDDYQEFCQIPKTDLPCDCFRREEEIVFTYDQGQYNWDAQLWSLVLHDLEASTEFMLAVENGDYSGSSIGSSYQCGQACDAVCENVEVQISEPPVLDNYYCMVADMNEQHGIDDPKYYATVPYCNPENGYDDWNGSECRCACTQCGNPNHTYYDFASESSIGCHHGVKATDSGSIGCPAGGSCSHVDGHILSTGQWLGNSANMLGHSTFTDREGGYCSKEYAIWKGYGPGGAFDPTCGPEGEESDYWPCTGHPDVNAAAVCNFCSVHLWGVTLGRYDCVDPDGGRNPNAQTGEQILADTFKANSAAGGPNYDEDDLQIIMNTGCAGCPDPWAGNYTGACVRDANGNAIGGFDGLGASCPYGINDWEVPRQHFDVPGCSIELCWYETGCSDENALNGPPTEGSYEGGLCNDTLDGGAMWNDTTYHYCKAPNGCANIALNQDNVSCCEYDYRCACTTMGSCNYDPTCGTDPTCFSYGQDYGVIDCTNAGQCDTAVAYCPDSDGDGLKDPGSSTICYVCEGYSQAEITGDGVSVDQCVNDNSIPITPCTSAIDPNPDCPDGTEVDVCGICGGANTFGTEPGERCDDSDWADNNDLPSNYLSDMCGAIIDDCLICDGTYERNNSQEFFSSNLQTNIPTQFINIFTDTDTGIIYCNCTGGTDVDCSYSNWNTAVDGDNMYNLSCGGTAIIGCDNNTCCEGGNNSDVVCPTVYECPDAGCGYAIPDDQCNCFGDALDECGECGGGGFNYAICKDCDGDGLCQDGSYTEGCGNVTERIEELNDLLGDECCPPSGEYCGGWVVVTSDTEYEPADFDECPWANTQFDCAGVCYDGNGPAPNIEDCSGECGGNNVIDVCGVCCDPTDGSCSDPAYALTAALGQGSGALDQCLVCSPDSPYGGETFVQPFQPDTLWWLMGREVNMTYGSFGCTGRDWFGELGTNQHPGGECDAPEQGYEFDADGNITAQMSPCGCMCAGCTNVHSPLWHDWVIYSTRCTDSEYNSNTCRDWNYNRQDNTDYCNDDANWYNCSFAPSFTSAFNQIYPGWEADWSFGGNAWLYLNSQENCYEGHGEMYFHYCNNEVTANTACCPEGFNGDGTCPSNNLILDPQCRRYHGDSCCGTGETAHCRVGQRSDLYWKVVRGNGAQDYDFSWDYYVICELLGNPYNIPGICDDDADGTLPGDVNYDGIINVLDVVAVVNHVMGDELDITEQEIADINGDGVVDILDIVSIVNMILDQGREQDGGRRILTKREEALIMRQLLSLFGNEYRNKYHPIYSYQITSSKMNDVDWNNFTKRNSTGNPRSTTRNTRDDSYSITGLDFLITAPDCIDINNHFNPSGGTNPIDLVEMGESFNQWIETPVVGYVGSQGAVRIASAEAGVASVTVNVGDIAYHLMSIYWPEVKFLGNKENQFWTNNNIIKAAYNDVDPECGDQTLPDCDYGLGITTCCVPLYRQRGNFGYGVEKPWKNSTMNNYCFLDNESINNNGGLQCPDTNPLCGCTDQFFTWTGKPAVVETGYDGVQTVHSFGNYGVCGNYQYLNLR